ncbi:hypothetical protein GYMLUDRAFT_43202 [Collybiopsis luxurians FD-317 M1]|uniref:Uncharacterized protein n=1 Tax=Collybiopsis luxurians FD-317 M1 TaxID=944289 RepID=A0A0D0BZ23_9AGAR|nr:hypothetical protein GYMLUDRAFT_43202 [Collybiopsis luxurians FD-317 M1]
MTATNIIDILILGAGWTSAFLIPLCKRRNISFAATTRSGSNDTIKFNFDQNSTSDDDEQFAHLPDAKTVLITFPITTPGASKRLVRMYKKTRKNGSGDLRTGFIQLGATSIWGEPGASSRHGRNREGQKSTNTDSKPALKPAENRWYDRHSPYSRVERSDAEDELLALSPETPTTVLNLAGLYGGDRSMRKWVGRVAPSKEVLKNKGSLHMVHGIDVARAILAIHTQFDKSVGQRWILTDGRVYDWWDLSSAWGSGPTSNIDNNDNSPSTNPSAVTTDSGPAEDRGPQAAWVRELMREMNVRALPRSIETLGRALDSREFWETFGLTPLKGRMEE